MSLKINDLFYQQKTSFASILSSERFLTWTLENIGCFRQQQVLAQFKHASHTSIAHPIV